jgi:hypothetical protein
MVFAVQIGQQALTAVNHAQQTATLIRAVNKATWTSVLPVSFALRALALTTSALIDDAIILNFLYLNVTCKYYFALLALTNGMAANVRRAICKAVRLYRETDYFAPPLPPLRIVLKNSDEFGSSTKTSLFLLKLAL